MRSQNLLTLLEYEATRRPQLATMMANINQLSEEMIRGSELPLPWMRQALLQYKRDHTVPVIDAIHSSVPDPDGEMRQWVGEPAFVRVGPSSLEVTDGQLVWLGPNGIWIDSIFTPVIDPLLHTRTVSRGRMRKSAYHQAVRSRVQRLPITSSSQGEHQLFRIYRPGSL